MSTEVAIKAASQLTESEAAAIELSQINRKLDYAIRLLHDKRPEHLTITDFARKAGVHRATISRWIRKGTLQIVEGKIPYTELKKFTSEP